MAYDLYHMACALGSISCALCAMAVHCPVANILSPVPSTLCPVDRGVTCLKCKITRRPLPSLCQFASFACFGRCSHTPPSASWSVEAS